MEHVVQEDECLHSIAEKYGFFWSTLWNHADNADLKNERKDPEALVPGDLVRIPPLTVRDEKCPADNAYVFRKKNPHCFGLAFEVEIEEPPILEAEAEFEEPPVLETVIIEEVRVPSPEREIMIEDSKAQAATLRNASVLGLPFCEECQRTGPAQRG